MVRVAKASEDKVACGLMLLRMRHTREEAMEIGGRSVTRMTKSLMQGRNWSAILRMFSLFDRPFDAFRRYVFSNGVYPHLFTVRSPTGSVKLIAYSSDDLNTINEVFCRHDYPVSPSDRIVVDFGSNIGITAIYFLTHVRDCFVYCYEPLPSNCGRMRKTLEGFEARYSLSTLAISTQNGRVNFLYEPTGRYGGIGQCGGLRNSTGNLEVCAVGAKDVLSNILTVRDGIDVLKIDIEGMEQDVLLSIPKWQLVRINKIFVECHFESNPIPDTHEMQQVGSIARFYIRPKNISE
jgi:FkbM family methyltransferase